MRQYVSEKMPTKQGKIRISGKDCRYMQQVLRLKRGDVLDVRFPDGTLARMQAVAFTKNYVELSLLNNTSNSIERGVSALKLEQSTKSQVKSDGQNQQVCVETEKVPNKQTCMNGCEYWLFQFMTRPQKMDQIIRQAVECGVAYIVPIKGDFSPVAASADRTERWQRKVKEALQQSGSSIATKIYEPHTLEAALQLWKMNSSENDNCYSFVLHENPSIETNLFSNLLKKPSKIALAVGCEGGISNDELNNLIAFKFEKLHFNTNILRAETATLYGIAVLQFAVMEFESWKLNV